MIKSLIVSLAMFGFAGIAQATDHGRERIVVRERVVVPQKVRVIERVVEQPYYVQERQLIVVEKEAAPHNIRVERQRVRQVEKVRVIEEVRVEKQTVRRGGLLQRLFGR